MHPSHGVWSLVLYPEEEGCCGVSCFSSYFIAPCCYVFVRESPAEELDFARGEERMEVCDGPRFLGKFSRHMAVMWLIQFQIFALNQVCRSLSLPLSGVNQKLHLGPELPS